MFVLGGVELLLKRLTKIAATGTRAEPSSCGRCISVHDGSIGIGVAACAGKCEMKQREMSKFTLGIQSESGALFLDGRMVR